MKPCPFCGWEVPADDDDAMLDVLHMSGKWWAYSDKVGGIVFRNHRSRLPDDNPCWVMNCTENMGGCGAEISGLTRLEAIQKWDRRSHEDKQ